MTVSSLALLTQAGYTITPEGTLLELFSGRLRNSPRGTWLALPRASRNFGTKGVPASPLLPVPRCSHDKAEETTSEQVTGQGKMGLPGHLFVLGLWLVQQPTVATVP